VKNVCEVLKVAAITNTDSLIDSCLKFFKSHRKNEGQVKSMEGWDELLKHLMANDKDLLAKLIAQ